MLCATTTSLPTVQIDVKFPPNLEYINPYPSINSIFWVWLPVALTDLLERLRRIYWGTSILKSGEG